MTVPRLARRAEFAPNLAAAARRLLREREERYPVAIERLAITAEQAERKLHLARCIVAHWDWIVDPASPPLPPFDTTAIGEFGAANPDMVAELVDAARRARGLADAAPDDDEAADVADLYEALAWLQQPKPGGNVGLSAVAATIATNRRLGPPWSPR